MTAHPSVETFARHVNPALVKLLGVFGYGRVFVRAQGTRLWDAEGREYLDFLAGFGATNLGHGHPHLTAGIGEFLGGGAPNLIHVGPSPLMATLAERLAVAAGAPFEIALFSSTGSEAVEAGLKLARAVTRRPGAIYCSGGFHGTSLGTLSVMGAERMRAPFEPLLSDCHAVPFGDLAELERALSHRPGAFLVEPILGEGGVVLPPPGYLREAQHLCRRAGTLLVLDEVQTGIGRTGSMFAFQQESFVPDVLVLGKALGGGIAPVSATLTTRELHDRAYGAMDRFDLHGSTFSGYGLGCAVALATLEVVESERLCENARARGGELVLGLRRALAGHPLVREVRGRGLLVGLELGPPDDAALLRRITAPLVKALSKNVFGQWLAVRLLERGIVCQPAAHRWDILKLEPPLVVTGDEIDRVVADIAEVLGEYRELAPLVKDVGARLGRQLLSGWRF
jgi:putrescine aminotransferase